MARNFTIKKVVFSPDGDDDHNSNNKPTTTTSTYRKNKGYGSIGKKLGGNKKRVTAVILGIRIPKTTTTTTTTTTNSGFSPAAVSFLKRIGDKVVKVLRFMSSTSNYKNKNRSSRKVSSSASLVRSRSYAETLDSQQRAEAIEDCIEFFNSSSSSSSSSFFLPRSNSVSSSC